MADVDYGGKSSSSFSCLSSITPTTTRFRRRARQRQLMLVLVGSMVSTTSSPMQTNGLQGYGEIYVNGQRVTDRDEVLFHGARALSGCPKSGWLPLLFVPVGEFPMDTALKMLQPLRSLSCSLVHKALQPVLPLSMGVSPPLSSPKLVCPVA